MLSITAAFTERLANQQEYNDIYMSDEEVNMVFDERVIDGEDDILRCIINMIELEYILKEDYSGVRSKGVRTWGIHPLNQMRKEQGQFYHLFEEMLVHDHDKFFNFTRITPPIG